MNTTNLLKEIKGDKWYNIFDEALVYCMEKEGELSLEFGIVDSEIAEEIAKQELEKGGLLRLYFFLNDVDVNEEYYRIDGYGNLANIHKDDVEFWLEEIKEAEEQQI